MTHEETSLNKPLEGLVLINKALNKAYDGQLDESFPRNLDINAQRKNASAIESMRNTPVGNQIGPVLNDNVLYKYKLGGQMQEDLTAYEVLILHFCPDTEQASIIINEHTILKYFKGEHREALNQKIHAYKERRQRIAEGNDSRKILRHRAPGGLIPLARLINNEEAKGRWESEVVKFIENNTKISAQSLMSLGSTLAKLSGFTDKSRSEIEERFGAKDAARYILTFHGACCDDPHGHECGAHGGNLKRSILASIAQAAMMAYATEGKKQMLIAGYPTGSDGKKQKFAVPKKDGIYDFFQSFFIGDVSLNELDEKESADNEFPQIQKIFDAITGVNEALGSIESTEGPVLVNTCSDERVGIGRTAELDSLTHEDTLAEFAGKLETSGYVNHFSNIKDVAIGAAAAGMFTITDRWPSPLFRSTIQRGALSIRHSDIKRDSKDIIDNIDLIANSVMNGEQNPIIQIRVVTGTETSDINNPSFERDTLPLLNDPDVTARFVLNGGIDPRKNRNEILTVDYLRKNSTSWEKDLIERYIKANAELVNEELDAIIKDYIVMHKNKPGNGKRELKIHAYIVNALDGTINTTGTKETNF